MGNIAIITGSSSGFGLLTTLELAKQGFSVLATMRNIEKADVFRLHTTDQRILDRIHPCQLDVTDEASIASFAEKIQTLGKIDVLINNAGFAIGGFAEHIEVSTYRRQFETNVFGVMAVTQVVLPLMREQGSGTIINVSSVSGRTAFPGLSAYVSSKFALEGYTESLRLEMKPFGVNVALVEPGSFSTNIWGSGMEIVEQSTNQKSPYYSYMKRITDSLESGKTKHEDPILVAKLITKLAQMKQVKKLRYPIGKGLVTTLRIKQLLSWQQWERIILKVIFKN
ncbi:SDR family oxidoreductase [Radiobacillus sp. PE A8.2]|uniref:SDR family oxidoreductase n=1 Tax=Radiobacillus sp. PE A8.2 TaxID=3380349 RepID=UPI00388EF179